MNREKLLLEIDRFVEDRRDDLFRDIARLVSVNSIEEAPEEEAPFGPGPKKALDEALAICRELGLKTRNCENRIGYAVIGGDDDKYLSTITHVDVVPAGNGWKADPFTMREREGYILGRGVIDDKGPSVVCMYALKFIQDSGISLRYPIRALFGANEETGMQDVKYYLAHYPAPLFCFSPDADFPLICGEKGIWHGKMTSLTKAEAILSISGGVAVNAVPDLCEATVRADSLSGTDTVQAVRDGDCWHLTAHGIAGHASMPKGTRNAILEDSAKMSYFVNKVENLNIRFFLSPDESGENKFNIISIKKKSFEKIFDLLDIKNDNILPYLFFIYTTSEITKHVETQIHYNIKYEELIKIIKYFYILIGENNIQLNINSIDKILSMNEIEKSQRVEYFDIFNVDEEENEEIFVKKKK